MARPVNSLGPRLSRVAVVRGIGTRRCVGWDRKRPDWYPLILVSVLGPGLRAFVNGPIPDPDAMVDCKCESTREGQRPSPSSIEYPCLVVVLLLKNTKTLLLGLGVGGVSCERLGRWILLQASILEQRSYIGEQASIRSTTPRHLTLRQSPLKLQL